MQKFNWYELLRNPLNSKERKNFIPIDVIYEPTLNDKKPIECFFAAKIYLTFRTTVEKVKNGKTVLNHTGARQCHYCNNYFVKRAEKMEKLRWQSRIYLFIQQRKNNWLQDHYKNLGDLPFTVYYDFETTTESVVFFYAKMYVESYCIIVAFHSELKIPKLVIFRSYDQNPNALISLTHFQALQYDFFNDPENYNKITLKQLEDAAFSVQNRGKKYCTGRKV